MVMSTYIDLYHHLSRAMYFDVIKKKLIDKEDAIKLRKKIQAKGKHMGWQEPNDNLTADLWKNALPVKIYGNIYKL